MNTSVLIPKQRYAIYHIGTKKFMFMLRKTPQGSPFAWMSSNGIFFTVSQENINSFTGYLNKSKYNEIGTVCTWMINFLRKENNWKNIMVVPLILLKVEIAGENIYAPDHDHSYQLWKKND